MANTTHIVPNALLSVPDPNVAVMKKCTVFPVEFVVRGFMTGTMDMHGHASVTTTRVTVQPSYTTYSCMCISMLQVHDCLCTGSTDTSLWTHYNAGARTYRGHSFPDGMAKNQRLDANVVTPTTKAVDHDVPISGTEIVAQGLMSQEDWDAVRCSVCLFGCFLSSPLHCVAVCISMYIHCVYITAHMIVQYRNV